MQISCLVTGVGARWRPGRGAGGRGGGVLVGMEGVWLLIC